MASPSIFFSLINDVGDKINKFVYEYPDFRGGRGSAGQPPPFPALEDIFIIGLITPILPYVCTSQPSCRPM